MKLEEVLNKRLMETESVAKHLALFYNEPAVFSPIPPDATDEGWNDSKMQYPRIVFNYDMQASTERNSAGVLAVSLFCPNTPDVLPEEIEQEIRKCMKDVLFKADDGTLYAFAWSRTDGFEIPDAKTDMIIGCDTRFDIVEYSNQETTDPDPVMAVNSFVKSMYPESLVIGLDRFDSITEASKEQPVIYCRLESLQKGRETNTVAWVDGRVAVHILCPDSETRLKMATAIVNKLSLDGEVIMLDKSPMFIKRLQANYKSDYLKDGQLFVTGEYGLLRYKAKAHTLQSVSCKYS